VRTRGADPVPRRAVLVVEDELAIRFSIARFFRGHGYQVGEADTCAKAEESFRVLRPDAAILDYCLPDGYGIDLLRTLHGIDAGVPIVILTAHGTIDLAVRAIKEGAEQFLTKPVELPTLLVVVERLIEHHRDRQVRLAGRSRRAREAIDPFLGESPAIRQLAARARRVLTHASPILIQGATGTGKGLLARWLHENGPRAEEAFVDLNCAGLSREFLETELFGHEKGAFTGAVAAKPGLLEIAHRGTAFLDEIGDVDLPVQPKLLKVLEEQRFRRLGDVRDRQVDVRLIAATHHDLSDLVRQDRFRSDLFYRISTIPLFVPALKERPGDVLVIARFLLERIGSDVGRPGVGLSGDAERALQAYSWPGNIRELRNVIERALLLSDGDRLTADRLAELVAPGPAAAPRHRLTLVDAERRHIAAILREEKGNVAQAAQVLGLSRSALYQKIKKHRLSPAGLHS
jgi:DNA-binding NtrC family response regulator